MNESEKPVRDELGGSLRDDLTGFVLDASGGSLRDEGAASGPDRVAGSVPDQAAGSVSDEVAGSVSDEVAGSVRDDFATIAVPLDQRYSLLSMGLLWITMVSGFPSVLVGYEWHKAGFSLTQVISGAFVSCIILLAYVLSASHLGAATGLNFALLTRSVFGRMGSKIISALQTFLFLVWYAMIAGFVAVELKGLFDVPCSTQCIAAIAAILMAANNLFGFAGVANFAKFFAAPVLIFWIFSLCIKTSAMTPSTVWTEPGTGSFASCLSVISSFVIGYSVWGNEPDFWRFAKPNLWTTSVPLVVSILIGQVVFPVSGWMLSRLVHIADLSTATGAVTNFSFGHAPLLAATVLTASYFAAGDANLYGSINSLENLIHLNRTKLVLGMMAFTAVVAIILTYYGKAFEVLSSFNSIVLPCATIILIVEYFWIRARFSLAVSDAAMEPAKLQSHSKQSYGEFLDKAHPVNEKPDNDKSDGNSDNDKLDGYPDNGKLYGSPDNDKLGGNPDNDKSDGNPDNDKLGGNPDNDNPDKNKPPIMWPAMVALLFGWIVGLLTAGVFRGTESLHVGVWPLYAWVTSLLIYYVLRLTSWKNCA